MNSIDMLTLRQIKTENADDHWSTFVDNDLTRTLCSSQTLDVTSLVDIINPDMILEQLGDVSAAADVKQCIRIPDTIDNDDLSSTDTASPSGSLDSSDWFPSFQSGTPGGASPAGQIVTGRRSAPGYYGRRVKDESPSKYKSLAEKRASERERQKKDNHNTIERRRRYNINDRIDELREMLPKHYKDGRSHKGFVLKCTVDYVRYLKYQQATLDGAVKRVTDLQQENQQLRDELDGLLRLTLANVESDGTAAETTAATITTLSSSSSSGSGSGVITSSDQSTSSDVMSHAAYDQSTAWASTWITSSADNVYHLTESDMTSLQQQAEQEDAILGADSSISCYQLLQQNTSYWDDEGRNEQDFSPDNFLNMSCDTANSSHVLAAALTACN